MGASVYSHAANKPVVRRSTLVPIVQVGSGLSRQAHVRGTHPFAPPRIKAMMPCRKALVIPVLLRQTSSHRTIGWKKGLAPPRCNPSRPGGILWVCTHKAKRCFGERANVIYTGDHLYRAGLTLQ